MSLLARLHGRVHGRRVRVLAAALADALPDGARVLDVGCGDARIDRAIQELRPDVVVDGVEIASRTEPRAGVTTFDGVHLPLDDRSRDVVLFVDVLHHTEDPLPLLREARRVAREAILIKDHTVRGLLATPTLRFMDWVGNARHGVPLPYNYWSEARWRAAFDELGLEVAAWDARLGLYPWPGRLVFERGLHFVARLRPGTETGGRP